MWAQDEIDHMNDSGDDSIEPRYANSATRNVSGEDGTNTTKPPRVSGTFEALGLGNQTYVRGSGRMASMVRDQDVSGGVADEQLGRRVEEERVSKPRVGQVGEEPTLNPVDTDTQSRVKSLKQKFPDIPHVAVVDEDAVSEEKVLDKGGVDD